LARHIASLRFARAFFFYVTARLDLIVIVELDIIVIVALDIIVIVGLDPTIFLLELSG